MLRSFQLQSLLDDISELSSNLSSNSMWFLVGSWLFCIQYPSMFGMFVVRAWRFCGHSVSFHLGSNSFWHGKEVLKWVWLLLNWNVLVFIQIQAIPPSMYHKWKSNYQYLSNSKRLSKTHGFGRECSPVFDTLLCWRTVEVVSEPPILVKWRDALGFGQKTAK